MTKSPDCVVVFKDAIERRMREKMDNAFGEMPTQPTILVVDDPRASDKMESSDRDYIVSKNPDNCSVWLRDDRSGQFQLAAKSGEDSASLMSKYFKTELLQKFADLALALQAMGVRSIAGMASEEEEDRSSSDKAAEVKLSGSHGAAKGSAEMSFDQKTAEAFKHEVKQQIKYSIAQPVDVTFDEMERIAREKGLINEPIIRSVLIAKKQGFEAWRTLSVKHTIDAAVLQSVNDKLDFAVNVAAKLPVGSGELKAKYKSSKELMNKVVQNFEICVDNNV